MDTVLTGVGANDNVNAQVDPTRQAVRVAIQPTDHTVGGVQGGHYGLAATTGAISAIAAAGQVFALRWNDASKIMLLERVTVSSVCTAFSTGTGADLELVRASSYTAAASGGTAITPSTTSQMSRSSSMASTSFNNAGELRIATTAALTPGTQTLDTAALGAAQLGATAAGGGSGTVDLFNRLSFGQYPVILSNNQGIVVRAATAVPSSNTFRYSVQVSWIELAAY